MPLKTKIPVDPPKTEHGATIGSTGEVVDALTNNFLIRKKRELLIQRSKEEAEVVKRNHQENGDLSTK